MNTVALACCQFRATPASPPDNIERMLVYARQASAGGASLVLYPEMILTGYLPPERVPDVALSVTDPAFTALGRGAAERGVALVFGFPERDASGRLYNSQAFVGSDGVLRGVYRKTHLWPTERAWGTPGEAGLVVEMEGVNVGGWICYDTRFPELARSQALAGAELALVSTAWLGPGEEWELALRARALDNGIFVAGADIVDPAIGCRGRSLIVDPRGAVLARAPEGVDALITARLDPEVMRTQRARVPLLHDRRAAIETRHP